MIAFYGYFRSSSAYRCRIAFNLKGVPYDLKPVHLRRDGGEHKAAAYRAVNPQGLVPTIVDGDFVLSQSLAIIEWLDETQEGPPLLPKEPNLRAKARAFAEIIACEVHPLQNLRVLDYLKNDLHHDQTAIDGWLHRWLGDGLVACEALLARESRRGVFAFGATPSLADICLIPQMFAADRFGVDLSGLLRLQEIRAACEALPAFADAHPSRQPDAEA